MFFQYIFVILHILTAAAWFGLALRIVAHARVALSVDPGAAKVVAGDVSRTVKLMNVFIILTLVFALIAFFIGGGFARYTTPYHTSILLLILLCLDQFYLIRPATSKLLAAVTAGPVNPADATAYRKRLAMATGIGHTLWVIIIILMFWTSLFAGM
ncbi:MAG TPA: hypothetical protein VFG50_06920 [Rhodothermales bacterium]|nr:hypothetical protein [Rhodothermales bacterium]